MIPDAEVRRLARRAGVEPRVIDLDYCLGWALRGLVTDPYLSPKLLFKGGTFLRKCYFPGYRFSEDLDFTIVERFDRDELEHSVHEAFARTSEASGIDFAAQEPRMELVNDEYGRESLQLRIYYRGPHPSGGSPRAIRVDLTHDEEVVFGPTIRQLVHPYSDEEELGQVEIRCYALEEAMTEKLRALLGQRKHAVSRDLYDIHHLLQQEIDQAAVHDGLPDKLIAKNIDPGSVTLERLLGREAEFRADWDRNLQPLFGSSEVPGFEAVWEAVVPYVRSFLPD